MAKPVATEEQNRLLEAPAGKEDEVKTLPVTVTDDEFVSCWELSAEELEEVKRTGRVWLHVMGRAHPPVFVNGNYPFENQKKEAQNGTE